MKELRLALVFYGGVSLAVYMHGVTKELHKLTLASVAYENRPDENPFGPNDTSRVYFDLLARMRAAAAGRVRTRVVIDIVSGTSAGGINGICLAKALADNRSLESLKQLWLEKADIGLLLRGPQWLPLRLRMATTVTGWFAKGVQPPLRGDQMCVWLHDAFTAMDQEAPPLAGVASLMPDDHRLELFVPVTDFGGYVREIPIEDPRYLSERTHRTVLTFRADGSKHDDFTAGHNHMLAFAARATSSFPGAFGPITIGDYRSAVRDATALGKEELDAFFPAYPLAHNLVEQAAFIDGGVLDNFPFETTIDAIAARPAANEVDRLLLYLEPDPSPADTELHESKPGVAPKVPGVFATVWGGIAAIPRDEPIVDDLIRLAERNDAVRRVRDIIEGSFGTISGRVHDMLEGIPLDAAELGAEAFVSSLPDVDSRVAAEAGFAYETYLRVRLVDVIDQYARAISTLLKFPVGSYHGEFVNAILHAYFKPMLEPSEHLADTQRSFLEGFDLGYVQRLIRFVIAAFSWWYPDCGKPGYPSREQLDAAKAVLYDLLRDVHAVNEKLADDEAIALLRRLFDPEVVRETVLEQHEQADRYATEHRDELGALYGRVRETIRRELPPIQAKLHDEVLRLTQTWSPEVKGAVLTRYLGFPFWDVLVFVVEALAGVGERDTVEVVRMSPRDSTLLEPPDPEKKLAGASLHHFGAFFDRPGRESDYLWGRLDAAERLITLLLHDPENPDLEPPQPSECRPAFGAILADEEASLTHSADLIKHLGRQIAP